jgi:hypothetical protein
MWIYLVKVQEEAKCLKKNTPNIVAEWLTLLLSMPG